MARFDSEEYHWLSWRDTMASEGIAITHEQFLKAFGQRNDSIPPQWLAAGASDQRIQPIGDSKEELYRKLVREGRLEPLPGLMDWVGRRGRQELTFAS
jgi:beta-phosphoglucomutase-like phosphatase (HAD superfamily)